MFNKVMACMGLVALLGLGITLSSMSKAPSEVAKPEVFVEGKLVSVGPCARLVTCDGNFTVNLVNLPNGYLVGQQVDIKGLLSNQPVFCALNTNYTIAVKSIALDKCG